MHVIRARNAHQMLPEALYQLRRLGVRRESRNGPVLRIPGPVTLEYERPTERVIFWRERDANPFFHLLESMWMLAGRNDVAYPASIVDSMRQFSDDGQTFHGAYGHRWRNHWFIDQVTTIAEALRLNPDDRRQVLAMWDASEDLGVNSKDIPCNTHAYFSRDENGRLDMTVCNRSNDLVWGMLGANAVHMTYLHELVASGAGVPVGIYRVFTTNLHVYKSVPRFEQIWETRYSEDNYSREVRPFPLVGEYECYHDILADCKSFCLGHPVHTRWVSKVLLPAAKAWYVRKINPEACHTWIDEIAADDWRIACREWVIRRQNVRSE